MVNLKKECNLMFKLGMEVGTLDLKKIFILSFQNFMQTPEKRRWIFGSTVMYDIFKETEHNISNFVDRALKAKALHKNITEADLLVQLVILLRKRYKDKISDMFDESGRFLFLTTLAAYIIESATSSGCLIIEKPIRYFSRGNWSQEKTADGVIVWSCSEIKK